MLPSLAQTTTGPVVTQVFEVVAQFADYLLKYAIALAAVGALAMALIELAKKLLDSRTKFHAKRWTAWVKQSGGSGLPEVTRRAALRELIQLCTGVTEEEAQSCADRLWKSGGTLRTWHALDPDPANAFFALDTGRMLGSIQDAADVALASPGAYPALYELMSAGASINDVQAWRTGADTATRATPAEAKALADAFGRLRQVAKRKLDGFQLYTEQRWTNYNQFWANVVGAAIMAIALIWLGLLKQPLTLVIASAFGGILSPTAKDLVTALRRVRSG
jgi:hypothetical protein